MAYVKVFADKQMDAQRNRWAKNNMPSIYRCGGIKRKKCWLLFPTVFSKETRACLGKGEQRN